VAEKKEWTVGGMLWKVVMVITALWLINWLLAMSGVNIL